MRVLLTIIFLLSSLNALAKTPYALDFELTSEKELLNKILKPIWKNLSYKYTIKSKETLNSIRDTITYKMEKADVLLGQKPEPLFSVSILDQDKLQLDWKFSKFEANIKAKLRFYFKMYGTRITHDEYFIIKAKGLEPSHTKLDIYFDSKFHLNNLKNTGFKLKYVTIKPKDGIGSILRYIFDNVFSEDEVDEFITKQVNAELKAWINDKELIQSIETAVNKQIDDSSQSVIKLSEMANHLKVKLNQFQISPTTLTVGVSPSFDYKDLTVHPCAKNMLETVRKDHINASLELIEQMMLNFSTYEIWENGRLNEPLFCMGYKDYDSEGNPLGEKAEFSFLGRDVKFTYWVTPNSKPLFHYLPDEKLIQLDLDFAIKIYSEGYPHLIANRGYVKTKVSAFYRIEYNPLEGINLIFDKFDITSITGRVKVKWGRFTPYIRVPLSLIMAQLEKAMNEQGNENFKVINLISEKIDFLGEVELLIQNYEMLNNHHRIYFKAL